MSGRNMIFYVKFVHSLIWLLMASAVFYILFSGITGSITPLTYYCIGLIMFEVVVLLMNGWACPLTNVAKEVKSDWQNGDDIFLPTWLAVHNKQIFGTLFVVGALLVIFRSF